MCVGAGAPLAGGGRRRGVDGAARPLPNAARNTSLRGCLSAAAAAVCGCSVVEVVGDITVVVEETTKTIMDHQVLVVDLDILDTLVYQKHQLQEQI